MIIKNINGYIVIAILLAVLFGSTGWSKAWKINLWARALDGNHAYKLLSKAIKLNTYPSLLDAHPPFQIDGNFGGTSGITEMLLQSQNGYLHILPALPPVWRTGKVTGLVDRGGFVMDIIWKDGAVVGVKIVSKNGTIVKLNSIKHLPYLAMENR